MFLFYCLGQSGSSHLFKEFTALRCALEELIVVVVSKVISYKTQHNTENAGVNSKCKRAFRIYEQIAASSTGYTYTWPNLKHFRRLGYKNKFLFKQKIKQI